jgi:acyl-CoA thioesterase-2
MGQQAVDDLVKLLDLEHIEVNIFRGSSPDSSRQRVFGGQVAGQALVAATRTVESPYHVHSLHAYFLRPGDTKVPILYDVDRIRDGKTFVTRRVVAIQHGKAIFNLSASFQRPEDGFDHEDPMPDGVPDPEELPTFQERMKDFVHLMGDEEYERDRPIDSRPADWDPHDRGKPLPPSQLVWMRADGRLPDDPVLHACIFTYASDLTLLDTTTLPHGVTGASGDVFMASLDHAMWFHRPFRADEWLLYAQHTPSTSGGRGFAQGSVFSRDGRLVISVAQEGLLRRMR